jgi:hypothetical protein
VGQDREPFRALRKNPIGFISKKAWYSAVRRESHAGEKGVALEDDDDISVNRDRFVHDAQKPMFWSVHRRFTPLTRHEVVIGAVGIERIGILEKG